MSPEEKQQFEDLKQKVEQLERLSDDNWLARLEERVIIKNSPFSDTSPGSTGSVATNTLLKTTTVGAGGGSVTTLNVPENLIEYRYKGKKYLLLAYDPR